MSERRIAVLGAGILGCSTALLLARSGCSVTLFDAAPQPFSGASRWNEGKIHLGFLYAGDPSLATARRILPGGLAFKPLVEGLLGCSISEAMTQTDDTYLIHKQSVASVDSVGRYFAEVVQLIQADPAAGDYLVDLRQCQVKGLSDSELRGMTNADSILGGFQVPERSVSTNWLADRYLEALKGGDQIATCMGARVTDLRSLGGGYEGPWQVHTAARTFEPFDCVVNAMWEGRIGLDARIGLHPPAGWTHRYRLSLFARTDVPLDAPSAVVSVGPFGDLKNYTGRDFYLSWYPAGLMAEGCELDPPAISDLGEQERGLIIESIISNLAQYIPAARTIVQRATQLTLGGGWVFAMGRGSLDDPNSTLHRRDRIGIQREGTYYSVDTGKYSIAPWLAKQIAESILGSDQQH
jgi:hypothetical protein